MPTLTRAIITEPKAASAEEATAYFESRLRLETDCWDVNEALKAGETGFVVIDVRDPAEFAKGHVPGAKNIPHGRINERNLSAFPAGTLFVVYCTGPHCNGADRGAIRLAQLGRPVKKMIGGIWGWIENGSELER
jgi:rhodanese-related sulfurtransferase